jgi:hypothetical protein
MHLIEFEIWRFVEFSMKTLFNNSYTLWNHLNAFLLNEGFPIALSAQMDPYLSSVFQLYQVCDKGNDMPF